MVCVLILLVCGIEYHQSKYQQANEPRFRLDSKMCVYMILSLDGFTNKVLIQSFRRVLLHVCHVYTIWVAVFSYGHLTENSLAVLCHGTATVQCGYDQIGRFILGQAGMATSN